MQHPKRSCQRSFQFGKKNSSFCNTHTHIQKQKQAFGLNLGKAQHSIAIILQKVHLHCRLAHKIQQIHWTNNLQSARLRDWSTPLASARGRGQGLDHVVPFQVVPKLPVQCKMGLKWWRCTFSQYMLTMHLVHPTALQCWCVPFLLYIKGFQTGYSGQGHDIAQAYWPSLNAC